MLSAATRLRRGFAGWARASGWDIKDLMAYVGWKDMKSALRYLETSDASLQARFEAGLAPGAAAPALKSVMGPALEVQPVPPVSLNPSQSTAAVLQVSISLGRLSALSRGLAQARRLIEQTCLERFAMRGRSPI